MFPSYSLPTRLTRDQLEKEGGHDVPGPFTALLRLCGVIPPVTVRTSSKKATLTYMDRQGEGERDSDEYDKSNPRNRTSPLNRSGKDRSQTSSSSYRGSSGRNQLMRFKIRQGVGNSSHSPVRTSPILRSMAHSASLPLTQPLSLSVPPVLDVNKLLHQQLLSATSDDER